MKLVKIRAPNNYIHKGKEVFVNPSQVSYVATDSEGKVFVKMKNGDICYSQDCVSKVISDLEESHSDAKGNPCT